MLIEQKKKRGECSNGIQLQKLFYQSMSGKNFLKRTIIQVIIFGLYHEQNLIIKLYRQALRLKRLRIKSHKNMMSKE